VLIALSLFALIRFSPTVGGPFIVRHAVLRLIQRYFTPISLGAVGLGMRSLPSSAEGAPGAARDELHGPGGVEPGLQS
jgi:hypothetical protein